MPYFFFLTTVKHFNQNKTPKMAVKEYDALTLQKG